MLSSQCFENPPSKSTAASGERPGKHCLWSWECLGVQVQIRWYIGCGNDKPISLMNLKCKIFKGRERVCRCFQLMQLAVVYGSSGKILLLQTGSSGKIGDLVLTSMVLLRCYEHK
ncbi:hypothetical protein V6N13_100242 [Hibiscus sabdariffa]